MNTGGKKSYHRSARLNGCSDTRIIYFYKKISICYEKGKSK